MFKPHVYASATFVVSYFVVMLLLNLFKSFESGSGYAILAFFSPWVFAGFAASASSKKNKIRAALYFGLFFGLLLSLVATFSALSFEVLQLGENSIPSLVVGVAIAVILSGLGAIIEHGLRINK